MYKSEYNYIYILCVFALITCQGIFKYLFVSKENFSRVIFLSLFTKLDQDIDTTGLECVNPGNAQNAELHHRYVQCDGLFLCTVIDYFDSAVRYIHMFIYYIFLLCFLIYLRHR